MPSKRDLATLSEGPERGQVVSIVRSDPFLANIGSSVVPIVNNNNYRDVASIFAGVADPSIKKYFGDMTESQQQIFLRESMPELLELKVGEEASKLVYFSRYGNDKIDGDQVLFIKQLGAAYKFNITAAIIVNAK